MYLEIQEPEGVLVSQIVFTELQVGLNLWKPSSLVSRVILPPFPQELRSVPEKMRNAAKILAETLLAKA